MKTRSLFLIGAAVFVLSLISTAPVALLYAKLVRGTPNLQPAGLDGTLFRGSASSLLLNGRPVLSNLHWQFHPLGLLLARASFGVDAQGDLAVDGTVAQRLLGGQSLVDLRATGPLKALLAASGQVGLPVDGQFGLKLDSAQIRSGFVTAAQGELSLNGLRWTLAKDPILLGDFVAHVSTANKQITATLESLAGPLEAGGEVRLLPDRTFEVDLQVKAKPTADALVQNLVRSLGQSDTQGFFHLRSTGSLGGPARGPAAGPDGADGGE